MFKETDLPDCIKTDMEDDREYTHRDNVFHVSELSYTCMFRQYMDRLEGKQFDGSAKWNIYRGRIFDQKLTKLFDENEVRVQHRIKGTPYIIRGRIDGLLYEENEIYEIKSVASIRYVKQPYPYHIPQGIFYLNSYDPLATLKFLYVSMDGYKVFEYNGDLETASSYMDEFERKGKILGKSLKTGVAPEPDKGNECKWCRYKEEGKCPILKPRKKRKK